MSCESYIIYDREFTIKKTLKLRQYFMLAKRTR